jgi:catechol 2,3-dioxygenase
MKPGAVRLNVMDLGRTQEFYERSLGLRQIDRSAEMVRLGAEGSIAVELVERPNAPPRPPRTTGLFHLAILVPSRRDLALALRRVLRSEWSLTGASDHLVSEALYLNDPEGNGIEVYRDRPREDWRYANGELQMSTMPLDLEALVAESSHANGEPAGMPHGTRIGHVHLNVSDLQRAESFYCGLLGFEVTVRSYPGALFVSTAGYHHHLGLNTWAGEGAPPPPARARGLSRFELLVDEQAELQELEGRLNAAGIETRREDGGVRLADPSGNGILIRPR